MSHVVPHDWGEEVLGTESLSAVKDIHLSESQESLSRLEEGGLRIFNCYKPQCPGLLRTVSPHLAEPIDS